MKLDPNDLSNTATLSFAAEFSVFHPWDGTAGIDTVGGPQWATRTFATGTLPYNNELQWYSAAGQTSLPDPFSVSNGALHITAAPLDPSLQAAAHGQTYTSGLIDTYHSFSQTYGYFEMRAELPAGRGLWPAFWLLSEDGSWPPELDVMEMIGNEPNTLRTTAHSKVSGSVPIGPDHYQEVADATVSDMTSGFHTYGIDWEPDTITWRFDGQAVFQAPTPPDLNKPMYMIANLAVGGDWPGSPDSATHLPAQMSIDYLRAYASLPEAGPSDLSDTFHFTNAANGDQFYTNSIAERNQVLASLPDYVESGVSWSTPAPGPDTDDVFRFLNVSTGEHFYTASAVERDHITASLSDFHYEGVAFQAYESVAAAGSGAVAVERFLDQVTGAHHYAAGASEAEAFRHGAGADWIDEGQAFIVHQPPSGAIDL